MKALFFVGLLAVLPMAAIAQNNNDEVYNKIRHCNLESTPEFVGGNEALATCIAKSLQYPADALQQKIEGYVLARFAVQPNGSVGDVEIEHSLSPSCDDEAKRVLRALPRFIPAKAIGGKAVEAWMSLPVYFTLPKSAKK
ncbi:MAG: energy transducer TonB [Bacteroidales bacterium]|nr:energy transducer TonB [Bacteroidales bacterium]